MPLNKGMKLEALAGYDKLPDDDADPMPAFLYAVTGRRRAALRVIENMRAQAAQAYVDPYFLAIA